MTVPTDPYNFTNGTTADGDQVDARFAPLYAILNGALAADNLGGALLNKWLKLASAVDRKVAFGAFFASTGLGGDRAAYNIPHGMGLVPVFAVVSSSWIPGAGTSTGLDEAVTFGVTGLDATNIGVLAQMTSGATATIGPRNAYWVAIG